MTRYSKILSNPPGRPTSAPASLSKSQLIENTIYSRSYSTLKFTAESDCLMKTAHKIGLARVAYRVLHASRTLFGKTDRCVVTRDGAVYSLDLSQGIDFAIYLHSFERETRTALRRLVTPSSTVLDIGANIGAHTLLLAQLVGPQGSVLSFEPTEFAFQKQAKNLALNPDLAGRVTAFQCLLAAEDDICMPQAVYSSWPLKTSD